MYTIIIIQSRDLYNAELSEILSSTKAKKDNTKFRPKVPSIGTLTHYYYYLYKFISIQTCLTVLMSWSNKKLTKGEIIRA